MDKLLLLVGLSSGFAHSLYSVFSKSLLKSRIKEPILLYLYINLLQAVLSPLIWLFVTPQLPPLEGWTPLLLAAATCVVAYLFLYSALACGDASSVMPIMGSKVILSGLLAIFMLNESHQWPVYVATLLVAISIGMLSYSPTESRARSFPIKPILLMLLCCVIFAFTDIYIKRSLNYLNAYNFIIYYNLLVALGSLAVLPYLKRKETRFALDRSGVVTLVLASGSLLAATLFLVITFHLSQGVVIPNILMSTRGVFIVIISAVLSYRGSSALDTQSQKVYLIRFAASCLILFSIWISLSQ